jgi:hypothetical protein
MDVNSSIGVIGLALIGSNEREFVRDKKNQEQATEASAIEKPARPERKDAEKSTEAAAVRASEPPIENFHASLTARGSVIR